MGIRKGIIISAAVCSMMACTACGSSDNSKVAMDAGNVTTEGRSALIVTTKDKDTAKVVKTEVGTEAEAKSEAESESGSDVKTEEKTDEKRGTEMTDNREDTENTMSENNYGEEEYWDEEDFSFDSILGIDQLDLKYEAHVAGFDGESFTYSVYTDDGVTDDKLEEIRQAIADFSSQSGDADNYMGYTDIQNDDAKILIYHDLGGVSEENCNAAIAGLLGALNNVPGIKQVIINEDMAGFDY